MQHKCRQSSVARFKAWDQVEMASAASKAALLGPAAAHLCLACCYLHGCASGAPSVCAFWQLCRSNVGKVCSSFKLLSASIQAGQMCLRPDRGWPLRVCVRCSWRQQLAAA